MSCDCVSFRGKRLDKRTRRMILRCERDFNVKLVITQGCCNKGGVAASGTTHDCEGVVDFSVNGLTQTQINRLVKFLRMVGFAAWYRPPIPGLWGGHIHAVAVGCKNLPAVAARQVAALRNGRDGLKSNRLDPHRGLKLPVITFETYLASKRNAKAKATIDISNTIAKARKGDFRAHLGTIMRAEGVPQNKRGYSRLQKRMGYTGKAADGIPGRESLTYYAKKHGYKVVA